MVNCATRFIMTLYYFRLPTSLKYLDSENNNYMSIETIQANINYNTEKLNN